MVVVVGGCVLLKMHSVWVCNGGDGVRREVWKKYEIGVIVNKC